MRAQTSAPLLQVEEHDARRVADGGEVAGEAEAAGLAVHAESGDVVAPLVAAVQERAGGVEGEAPRVAPAGPLLPDVFQGAWARAHYDGEVCLSFRMLESVVSALYGAGGEAVQADAV